jgi:hypothetical protein
VRLIVCLSVNRVCAAVATDVVVVVIVVVVVVVVC